MLHFGSSSTAHHLLDEMLCSIPKRSTSSSGWLDRLRTSKGFPIPAAADLEHFLTSSGDSPPEISDPPPPDPSSSGDPPHSISADNKKKSSGNEQEQMSDLITNVLAELFIMDGPPPPRTLAERRSSRKQPNPKICIPSPSASAGGSFSAVPAMSPTSADNSVVEARRCRAKPRKKRGMGAPVDSDLSAYSRTEVTVIDTSLPAWKAEKLIFRRGSVWKIRDKKLRHVCRKKRKMGMVERLVGDKEKEQQPRIDAKAMAQKDPPVSSDEGCSQTDKVDASKETEVQIQIPLRRTKFSRSPRVPAAKDSSLFRPEIFATSSKKGQPALKPL